MAKCATCTWAPLDSGLHAVDDPFALELEYVQRMMAWLLFVEPTSVTKRHAMQLGLGAGAITKFLPQKTAPVRHRHRAEPAGAGRVPPVVRCRPMGPSCASSGRCRQGNPRPHVAGHGGCPGGGPVRPRSRRALVLDSPDFYADCRALLSEDGCMTVNLFGRSSSFERSLQSMATAFGEEALWAFAHAREGNTVVLAQRTPRAPSAPS